MSKIENKVCLLLLESQGQYEYYKAQKENLEPHELMICCLTVSVAHYCKKNGVNFILPEDCYSKEESEHYQELSEKKIKSLVKCLNEHYHESIVSKDGFLFDMGNYHFFILYHFFGALHYRAFFLWKVIEKYNVDRILVFEEPKPAFSRPFPLSLYTNCYLNLLQNSIYREKIECIPIQSKIVRQHSSLKIRVRSFLSNTLRKFEVVNEYLNCVQNNIPVNFFRLLSGRLKSDILLIGSAYSWKYVFTDPRIEGKVSVLDELDEISISPSMVKNWFKEWFNWEDEFCGFTVSALGYYEMARVNILSEKIIASHDKTIQKIKQKQVLIYAIAPYASQQYFLSVAKFCNIPRVCFQHGESTLYYNGLWDESGELLYPSHYFSYGDQISINKTKLLNDIDGFEKAISIGSPALDKIKKTALSEKSYILYASSKYMNYSAGFNTRYTDEAVKKNQIMLINYFEKHLDLNPDSKVIWKLNQERLAEQPEVTSKKVKVIRDEVNFTDLIPNSKIIILDRPSTTALEACMVDKPLFILLAGKNWFSLSEHLLKKRAIVAYSPEELLDAIDNYLLKGIYSADINNKEFVKAYGCYLDDGLSSIRAADELLRIMGENSFG